MESNVAKTIVMIPECNGDESKLLQCMENSDENIICHHHMLVDCSLGSNKTDGDDDERSTITTQQQPSETNEEEEYPVGGGMSFDLGAILGMIAVFLAVITLVLVSVITIVCLWKMRKKRSKGIPQSCNFEQDHTADQM